MNKEWKVKEKDEEKISEMVKEYNISPILADCLIKRNIVQENDIRKFLGISNKIKETADKFIELIKSNEFEQEKIGA